MLNSWRTQACNLTTRPVDHGQARVGIQPERGRLTAALIEQRQNDPGGVGCQGGLSLALDIDQFDALRPDYARHIPSEGDQSRQRDHHRESGQWLEKPLATLEDHIEKALKGQLTDLKDYPDVVTELRQIHRQVEHHISDLRALSDRRKAGGVAEAVKRAGSAVAGAAAGLIDLVRSEGLPKN